MWKLATLTAGMLLMACGPPPPVCTSVVEVVAESRACSQLGRHARLLVVDWRSGSRLELEVALRHGGVVLAADCRGIGLLPDCRFPAKYDYRQGELTEHELAFEDVDAAAFNLPTESYRLDYFYRDGRSLELSLVQVGSAKATVERVARGDLEGRCDGATHAVTQAHFGAFQLVHINPRGYSDITPAGPKRRELLIQDGRREDCQQTSEHDPGPPPGCQAILAVDLLALDVPPPADDAERLAHACPQGSRWRDDRCVPAPRPPPEPAPADDCL